MFVQFFSFKLIMKEARKIENNPLQVILNYTGEPPHCEHGMRHLLILTNIEVERFFCCETKTVIVF